MIFRLTAKKKGMSTTELGSEVGFSKRQPGYLSVKFR